MITIEELPSIHELHDLIDSVPSYPLSASELADLAIAEGAGRRVVDFYRNFPAHEVFTSADDLTSRSEQVQMMSAEEYEQPWEQIRSPEE